LKKALLVIGNSLRGDDGMAIYLGKMVEENLSDWKVFYGEDIPEDKIPAIRNYKPDILAVADAVLGLESKKSEFLKLSDSTNYIYSTHNIPVEILIQILQTISKEVIFFRN